MELLGTTKFTTDKTLKEEKLVVCKKFETTTYIDLKKDFLFVFIS